MMAQLQQTENELAQIEQLPEKDRLKTVQVGAFWPFEINSH